MNADYLVGTVLENRYEILEMIGSGGMATVYKAKCRVLNRFVAIKVLKDSLKYDSEVVKKFNAESRSAAALSHPNIVQVYDVSENSEISYIVMEYIDGVTLKDYISKKGALDWSEACDFAIQIGKALEVAHKNHIIHKDIKPHNVLINRDRILKVADFGIAQAASTETIVAGNGGMGSVHYISPEQGRGGYIDERSDIYSLGVVLYEMLTGKLPFDAANPVSIAVMKLEKEPLDCKIVNPDIPDAVAKITMKAISKEQHSRYQSASEMVSDLQKVLDNVQVTIEKSHEKKFETNRINKDEAKERYYMGKDYSKKKKSKSTGLIAIVLILVALLFGFGTYLLMSGGTQEYPVPNLEGLTIEQAEEVLEERNLQLSDEVEFEESDDVEEGLIIRQTPGANQSVKKNRKIKIVVSLGVGEGEIKVPDVEDIPVEDAEIILKKSELNYKIEERYDENTALGYVIGQSPKKGTKVSRNYTIILYVCAEDEEEQAVVPKLTGVTEEQAKKLLEEAGLSVGTVDHEANSAPKGSVISQTPPAKTGVVKGSAVSFTVSTGEKEEPVLKRKTLTITIPDNANDVVHLKVVANGKTIHDKDHNKSEGTVDIEVQASKNANVQAYIDGQMVVDKVIVFE